MAVELRAHQKDAVSRIHNGCVLWGGVGTGKSMTAMAYYMKEECPRDIYIITTAKKRDKLEWNGEAARFGIGTARDSTVGGVLKVDSWNNLGKYSDVVDAFFIFDEQRLVGSGTWVKTFLKLAKKNHWILLSATPGDVWMDYAAIFVANGYYRNRTDFREQHVIYSYYGGYPKIERYVGTERLRRLKGAILVEMPYSRETVRHDHIVQCSYDEEATRRVVKDRWHIYEERPLVDIGELFRTMRKLTNLDESRLQKLDKAVEKHKRLIVFYNFDYELEAIRKRLEKAVSLSGRPFTVSEWNGHKHQEIPQTDSWVYLVQYQAGAEGWNCVLTDTMMFYSLPYSYKLYEQAKGRIDRLNTEFVDLHYLTLMSKAPIDRMIWSKLKEKKSFQEHGQKQAFQKSFKSGSDIRD